MEIKDVKIIDSARDRVVSEINFQRKKILDEKHSFTQIKTTDYQSVKLLALKKAIAVYLKCMFIFTYDKNLEFYNYIQTGITDAKYADKLIIYDINYYNPRGDIDDIIRKVLKIAYEFNMMIDGAELNIESMLDKIKEQYYYKLIKG